MSGGSLEYASFKINSIIENLEKIEHKEIEFEIEEVIKELNKLSSNLYQLEWYISGDISGDISIENMRSEWLK
jgi:hypothetical protein